MKKSKQTFMQGVMVLMFSQLIIKIIGLIYKIYLTNKPGFGDTGNAIFSAGFQIYTLFLAISSIGVPNAIAQLTSAKLAVGDSKGAYRIFKVAISIFGVVGFIGSLVLYLFAEEISCKYLGIVEAEFTITALSPSIFIVAISAVLRGYFNGYEKISVTANSQSIEQIIKTILTVVTVEFFAIISRKNTMIMVAGAAIATTLSTFFSFGYLYISYIKNKKQIWQDLVTSTTEAKEGISKIIKNIVCLTVPMGITALLSATSRTVDAFSIVNIISKYMDLEEAKIQYGILTGKVEGLVVLPYSFNIAFATTLIPTISASRAKGEMEKANKRINFSILATILISLPCTAIFVFFAEPILKLLFPKAYLGKTMLQICSLSIVFVAITQTIGGVLQGLKEVRKTVIAISTGVIIKLILTPILLQIKQLNINGAIIATIISNIVTFGISFYYLKKYINTMFDYIKFIFKPIIATSIMILISYFIYNVVLNENNNLNLIISLLIGIAAYFISIILLKTLSKEEICMLPYGNKLLKAEKSESLKPS